MTDDRIPTDAELAAARQTTDDLVSAAGVPLDDAALWGEPSPGLLDTITSELDRPPVAQRRAGRWQGLAAVAAVVVLIAATAVALRSPAPDWEVALFATEAAPGASGVAKGWNEDSGTRVELELEGLAEAPPGFFYELWFSEGPIHISAGTFHGTGDDVTLWAAVSRKDFPRVWITLEPIDDDPAPGVNILDTERSA